jgi:beta,beta-carotene 9',10'-dioxygenase
MVHDFALTKTKAIFVVPPIVLPRVPLGLVLGQQSFGESLRYRPELGVNIAVVDRATGETRWSRTDPFMMFHTVNAWDERDDVVLDVCAYPDARIMRTIEDVMVGDTPQAARA